jgi:hypothetical protein
MNIKLTLTDQELGFLYGMLYRATQERSFRRRRGSSLTEAEKLAQKLSMSVRMKARKALPQGAAQAIEVMNAGLL